MAQVPSKEAAIDQLNSFLRGELSAVESYKEALTKITDQSLVSQLHDCMTSHQQRAELLRNRVIMLGGKPSADSGPWGAMTKLVSSGAAALGTNVAIAALEEGEDHGMSVYKDLDNLDMESRTLVEQQILPAERQTHRVMSNLKRGLNQQV